MKHIDHHAKLFADRKRGKLRRKKAAKRSKQHRLRQ